MEEEPTRLETEAKTVVTPAPTAPAGVPGPPVSLRSGRYGIEGELGRGGMGVVLRALDRELRRPVALKIASGELARDPSVLARFLAEAQVTAQLQHPAIVPVYDLGRTDEGDLFYTMHLVEGRTLGQLIGDGWADPGSAQDSQLPGAGKWTLLRVLHAFIQVCRALAYAHERGVVHRDLKPANVMVGAFGEVHVMDWGLAKVLGDARTRAPAPGEGTAGPASARVSTEARERTRADDVLGTPGYMAPEQAGGDPDAVGPLADVYSLGAILYAILTGRAPHAGPTHQVLSALFKGVAPPSPRTLAPDVPEDLARIALAALAHEPAARPASAEALAQAVEGYLEGRPFLAAASGPDAAFLAHYRAEDYRRPSVTVDVVLVSRQPGQAPRVLLMRRPQPPFQGAWALPGRFLGIEETLADVAARVLREEGGVVLEAPLEPLGVFDDPKRDPRTRVLTVVHGALVAAPPALTRAPGAPEAAWFQASEPDATGAIGLLGPSGEPGPALAFDHARILARAIPRLLSGPARSTS